MFRTILTVALLCLTIQLCAQEKAAIEPKSSAAQISGEANKASSAGQKENDINKMMPWLIAGFVALLTFLTKIGEFFTWLSRIYANAKARTSDRNRYRQFLREDLGTVGILTSGEINALQVKLLDSYVSLQLTNTMRTEDNYSPERVECHAEQSIFSPEELIKASFRDGKLLVIVGDAGSGKTTLLKYTAIHCINGKYTKFGLPASIIPLYLPMRVLKFESAEPDLAQALAEYTKIKRLNSEVFSKWLENKHTLILLDGLDEISDDEMRRKACKWADDAAKRLYKAKLIVTSRWTGIDKEKKIEITYQHVRADVRDFTTEQRNKFINQWFKAAAGHGIPPQKLSMKRWKKQEIEKADQDIINIIQYLDDPKNKNLAELAVNPLVLQIITLLWKFNKLKTSNRAKLYSSAVNYLLDDRPMERNIQPFMESAHAVQILKPTAMWMQQEVKRDNVEREEMHKYLEQLLAPYSKNAEKFCKFLCEHASLLVPFGKTAYMFRHKSYREYFVGERILDVWQNKKVMRAIAGELGEEWWKEPLRFFFNRANSEQFNAFMDAFFSYSKKELTQKEQNFLMDLIKEAPTKPVSALRACLNNGSIAIERKRYVLEALKTIGSADALAALKDFADAQINMPLGIEARMIVAEHMAATASDIRITIVSPKNIFAVLLHSIQNPFELNAEYILIPGGEYTFHFTKQKAVVPNTYFAKYPVTNRRYRLFLDWLLGDIGEFSKNLPLDFFADELRGFAKTTKGFADYLGADLKAWPERLKIKTDDKKFLGNDQPVIGVTWYDAAAYCVWLTLLQAAREGERIGLKTVRTVYRLPHEKEWEWAAGREASGSLRDYPWPKEKGEPTPKLANYGENVGATTPVGRYPEGATPEGLLDMAGNVWEWQSNWYDKDKDAKALRGGSWCDYEVVLRCDARISGNPVFVWHYRGFRVVLSESSFFDTLNL